MNHKVLIFFTALPFLLGLSGLQAQTSVNASGGEVTGSGGSASYSVGQVFISSQKGTNGTVSQGVQTLQISEISSLEDVIELNMQVKAYPNPTSDILVISFDEDIINSFSFRLYDINGKVFTNEKIYQRETMIEMGSLNSGNYFLEIIQNDKGIKTFKVIKN